MGQLQRDIRVHIGFIDHPKTRRLRLKYGADAVLCLLRLFCWASENRPKGNLDGLEVDEIDAICHWTDTVTASVTDPVTAFVGVGYLDEKPKLKIHQWSQHQPFVFGRDKRQKASKIANKAKRDKRLQKVRGGDRPGIRPGDRISGKRSPPPPPPPHSGEGGDGSAAGGNGPAAPDPKWQAAVEEHERLAAERKARDANAG